MCSSPWEQVFMVDPAPEGDPALAALAPPLRLAGEGGIHPGSRAGADRRAGIEGSRRDDRIPRRCDRRGADRALVRRHLAERDPQNSRMIRLLLPEPRRISLRSAFAVRGAAARYRAIADHSRLVAGWCAPGDGDFAIPELAGEASRKALAAVRLQRAPALGPAAACVGSCVVGARRARVGFRAARFGRAAGLAALAAAQLQGLQPARQCRARLRACQHAGDRRRQGRSSDTCTRRRAVAPPKKLTEGRSVTH